VQLRALRLDLQVGPLRGNLDTRLRKLDEGGYDAIVLAAAGLKRLGAGARIRDCFETTAMLPCAGQGALAIEVRGSDDVLRECLDALTHRPTALAVQAERAVSRALGGNCSMPLAAHAAWQGDQLMLAAALGHPALTGAALLRASASAGARTSGDAEALGQLVADALRAQGAEPYLQAAAALGD